MRATRCLLLLLLCFPAPASAITLQDVVTLSKSGVSDTLLIAMIDRDKNIFAIDADELAELTRAGVSEPVILAMLHSGRDVPLEPSPIPPPVVSAMPAPDLVIVGHAPGRPNTADWLADATPPFASMVPAVVFVPVIHSRRERRTRRIEAEEGLPVKGIFFTGPQPRGLFFDGPLSGTLFVPAPGTVLVRDR